MIHNEGCNTVRESAMPNTDKELFRIKPLEWEAKDSQVTGPSFTALVGDRVISVFHWPWEHSWMWTAGDRSCQPCASPEAGKQLAEKHWRAFIEQALEPVEEGLTCHK